MLIESDVRPIALAAAVAGRRQPETTRRSRLHPNPTPTHLRGRQCERGKFVYFENGGVPGTVVETSRLTPARRRIFEEVRASAVNWNGRDPIRPMASLSAMLR